MSALDRDTVYLVESAEDQTVLVAVFPRLSSRGVEWFDSVRDRGFRVESVERDGDAVAVKTPNATYRFTPLTIDLYRARVQRRVSGKPAFSSTESVQRYYRKLG